MQIDRGIPSLHFSDNLKSRSLVAAMTIGKTGGPSHQLFREPVATVQPKVCVAPGAALKTDDGSAPSLYMSKQRPQWGREDHCSPSNFFTRSSSCWNSRRFGCMMPGVIASARSCATFPSRRSTRRASSVSCFRKKSKASSSGIGVVRIPHLWLRETLY